MKRLTNCLVFALGIWIASRGRHWLSVHRSMSFHGKIPHFGVLEPRGELLILREAEPIERKHHKTDQGGFWPLFRPRYHNTIYTKSAQFHGDDFNAVEAQCLAYIHELSQEDTTCRQI